MSTELATQYADGLIAGIEANDEAGTPFGIVTDDSPVTDRETGDEIDALDYLSDALDFQYVVTSNGDYQAARVCIAYGGPTAWIDTRTGQLEVSWWSETIRRDLPQAFTVALNEALSELWATR